jgi:RimJ/RimL family protein N-acetyltransferase
MKLRAAHSEDCELLFAWANDPETRAMAFSNRPIPWEDHCRWFTGKLQGPGCVIYIAVDEADRPLGQVRFDRLDGLDEAVVDVSIDPLQRGAGLGPILLQRGLNRYFSETPDRLVHALIKEDNVRSQKAFAKAGFVLHGKKTVHGCPCLHLVRQRPCPDLADPL